MSLKYLITIFTIAGCAGFSTAAIAEVTQQQLETLRVECEAGDCAASARALLVGSTEVTTDFRAIINHLAGSVDAQTPFTIRQAISEAIAGAATQAEALGVDVTLTAVAIGISQTIGEGGIVETAAGGIAASG